MTHPNHISDDLADLDDFTWCEGCEDQRKIMDMERHEGYFLCSDCRNRYENRTGHCSLSCCIWGQCDDAC